MALPLIVFGFKPVTLAGGNYANFFVTPQSDTVLATKLGAAIEPPVYVPPVTRQLLL